MKRLLSSCLSFRLGDPPVQDSIEKRIASLLQFILVGLIGVIILATLVSVIIPTLSVPEKINMLSSNLFGLMAVVLPLGLLRRGYFRGPLLIIISILLLTPTLAILIAFDLLRSDGILFQYTLA